MGVPRGRTSGFGTPEQVLKRRDYNHDYNDEGFGEAKIDAAYPTVLGNLLGIAQGYAAMRGREQQEIDALGGIGNWPVANKRRGVSVMNFAGRDFWIASNIAFGPLYPYTGY